MGSSKISTFSFLSLLAFAFLLRTVLGANPALFHFCSTSQNFTAQDSFGTNLHNALNYLSYHTPPTGFALTSSGQTQTTDGDKVYGLALCRGDVSTSDCKTCVADAVGEIQKRCHFNKGGVIWYDYCLLKYSDDDFFGKIDNRNRFYMWNLRVVNETERFNEKTKALLSELAEKAYASKKLYAVGEMDIEMEKKKEKLYGLTQCTRDLSRADCKKCLDGIIGEIRGCCDGKEGGRVVGVNCNFRYEIYPFVNNAN